MARTGKHFLKSRGSAATSSGFSSQFTCVLLAPQRADAAASVEWTASVAGTVLVFGFRRDNQETHGSPLQRLVFRRAFLGA